VRRIAKRCELENEEKPTPADSADISFNSAGPATDTFGKHDSNGQPDRTRAFPRSGPRSLPGQPGTTGGAGTVPPSANTEGIMAWVRRKLWLLAAAVLVPAAGTGCTPFVVGGLIVGPSQPWVTERMEEKFSHKNDHRTPIMPPVRDGYPLPMCEDAPSDQEVLRTLPRVARGVPYLYEEHRTINRIAKNRLVDRIDPPRFFPLVGMAQLHACHWECAVYYTETIQTDYPWPYKRVKERIQVVYIDKDHLHLYVGPNPDSQKEILQEMTKW
jgi:hypothetical protein